MHPTLPCMAERGLDLDLLVLGRAMEALPSVSHPLASAEFPVRLKS